ncbi:MULTISPECIES: DUF6518 family protein [unclassified Curtobacterium]|uniref:DUF6518 family protein n=1 Tax=unclassified Curtobacterium TaxID=257496 RepID=UPI0008DD997F|nr:MULTISPECIES: DUF6518 family protein [unclassified Curtobacterium]OIH98223.1 hypothetical protein BIU92_14325 [Curtobacterium sp. MCBA15_003]OII31248.1 hypothetical protein BIU94_04575 [Curtobacterium sp. MMLR14_006]
MDATLTSGTRPTTSGDPVPSGCPAVPAAARVTMALSGALLAGVGTSFGQAVPALSSASNSAGPWFVVAAALCLAAGVRAGRSALPLAMVLGVVLLELMHVGYWATSNLRGYPDSLSITNPWVLLGVPAGLLAGAVAVSVRSRDERWRAGALGVSAAVLVGEGIRALLQVAATTGHATWVVEVVVGVALLLLGVGTARTPLGRVVALGTGVLGTLGVLGAYLLISG